MSIDAATNDDDGRVLLIYLEPAPYIVALVAAIRTVWQGDLNVRFVAAAASQPWSYRPDGADRTLPTGTWNALREIGGLLMSGRYRLLHLAGWGHPVLFGALLIGWWCRTPVVVESDTQLPRTRNGWKDAVKHIVYPLLFKLPAAFLPGGQRQMAYLRHYGVDPARMRNAQMTVDVEAIMAYSAKWPYDRKLAALADLRIPQDGIRFLYLGRLEPHKGLRDLISAFQSIKSDIPAATLIIAGDGSLRSLIEEQAVHDPAIRYLGRLEAEQVWEAYALADVFVLPSHFEPWGLVVNEAMASGLPVIATEAVGCIDDLVTEGETGVIVPAGSAKDLAAAMKKLANDASMRQHMGEAAQRLISGWTLRNTAEITTSVWRGALG